MLWWFFNDFKQNVLHLNNSVHRQVKVRDNVYFHSRLVRCNGSFRNYRSDRIVNDIVAVAVCLCHHNVRVSSVGYHSASSANAARLACLMFAQECRRYPACKGLFSKSLFSVYHYGVRLSFLFYHLRYEPARLAVSVYYQALRPLSENFLSLILSQNARYQ